MSEPLLSVCLITYNHINYISEAIDGVLMQKVNFPWELIIADDFSTDGTREIVLEHKKKHPEFIKLILQEKNVGPAQNWIDLINAPKSKYIAYFEGDDYWTDPYKLQKQVDFLEANPEYGLIYSDLDVVNCLGKPLSKEEQKIIKANKNYEGEIFYKIIKYGNCVYTLTVCFRRELISDWLKKSHKRRYSYIQDIFLWLLIAAKSKVIFVNEITGAYRRHPGNLSQDPYTIVGRKTIRYSVTLGIEYYVKHNKNRILNEDYILLLKNLIMHLLKKRELFLKFVTIKVTLNYSLKFVWRKLIKRGT